MNTVMRLEDSKVDGGVDLIDVGTEDNFNFQEQMYNQLITSEICQTQSQLKFV